MLLARSDWLKFETDSDWSVRQLANYYGMLDWYSVTSQAIAAVPSST